MLKVYFKDVPRIWVNLPSLMAPAMNLGFCPQAPSPRKGEWISKQVWKCPSCSCAGIHSSVYPPSLERKGRYERGWAKIPSLSGAQPHPHSGPCSLLLTLVFSLFLYCYESNTCSVKAFGKWRKSKIRIIWSISFQCFFKQLKSLKRDRIYCSYNFIS